MAVILKKNILILILFLETLTLFSQTKYVGIVSATCENYTNQYSSIQIYQGRPSQGSKFEVFKNNKRIASGGGGDYGCCYVVDIIPLTDSVIFIAISNKGLVHYIRTIDGGETWENFDDVGVIEFESTQFFTHNTGYCFARHEDKLWIIRTSNTNHKTIYDGLIDKNNPQIIINDTLFSEPNCPEIEELVYRFNQDSIDIDYHIKFSTIITGSENYRKGNDINIFPNPTNGVLTINIDFDCNMSIFDISGKLLEKQIITRGSKTIDVSDYESGFYLISFQTQKSKFDKIIIKN